ncbi:hypothetical protein GFY24_00880 [Nocardia sp. SYP-A9097]|nr:hypothetical protein [Nocardia sp. SYP-A9097]MRH86031.1 hypothetical protein [Nocardia sp. SYP-A9097]
MSLELIPDEEMPAVLAAVREGRCICCYKEFPGEGFYCPDCDDTGEDE